VKGRAGPTVGCQVRCLTDRWWRWSPKVGLAAGDEAGLFGGITGLGGQTVQRHANMKQNETVPTLLGIPAPRPENEALVPGKSHCRKSGL